MRKLIVAIGCVMISSVVYAATDTCMLYNDLNNKIKNGAISKAEGLKQLSVLIPMVTQYYYNHRDKKTPEISYSFPLIGYKANAAGGSNGSGYIASGYDFFAGNKHGGHPAHDLFIHDANQDGVDDKTNKEVSVVACSVGVVVATERNWQEGSEQRGGNYIWIYEPAQRRLYYYAHNNKVLVKPGDIVAAGTPIATVGRTGKNAAQKRSPTHLHFMVLRLDTAYYPRAENCYELLKTAH